MEESLDISGHLLGKEAQLRLVGFIWCEGDIIAILSCRLVWQACFVSMSWIITGYEARVFNGEKKVQSHVPRHLR